MSSKELSAVSAKKPTGFSVTRSFFCLIKIVILTGILLIGLIPLIYHHGSDVKHEIDEHPLYKIFEQPAYRLIYKQMDKRSSNRVILQGSFEGGLKHFLEHYANKKTQKGKHVVFSQVEEEELTIQPYLKQARYVLEQTIDIEADIPTLWIVISENEFPLVEVSQLIARHPKDRIIVATSVKDSGQKSFKTISYPGIDPKEFKSQMVDGLKVDTNEVDIIYQYFGSLEIIFNMVDEKSNAMSKENLLGEDLKSMELLTAADKDILEKLCRTGSGTSLKSSKSLDSFGCLFYSKKYYWDHGISRLNYELLMNKSCPHNGIIPEVVRQRMDDEIRQQEQERQKKKRDAQEKERRERQAEIQKKQKERQQKQKEKAEKTDQKKGKAARSGPKASAKKKAAKK